MELNREQIIKALECCRTNSEMDCNDCHYRNKGNDLYDGCVNTLLVDALSLINKLTEDVERLRKQCGEAIVECDERDAERLKQVAELAVENERLHASCTELTQSCTKLTEENERLRKALDTDITFVRVCRGSGKTAHLREVVRIRADAIKANTVRKMHSELYEEFLKVARCQKSGEPNMTSQEVLAILKRKSKEMLEGKE